MATRRPKAPRNSAATDGVSAISGTSISTCRSVFVGPAFEVGSRPPGRNPLRQAQIQLRLAAARDAVQQGDAELAQVSQASSCCSAATCSSVSRRAGSRATSAITESANGSRSCASSTIATRPCRASRLTTSAVMPRSRSSDSGTGADASASAASASRCPGVSRRSPSETAPVAAERPCAVSVAVRRVRKPDAL